MKFIKWLAYWLELLGWRHRTKPFERWMAAYNLVGMQDQWPCVALPHYGRKTDKACPYIIFADTSDTVDFILEHVDDAQNDEWEEIQE